jgi:hypothetical protein
MFKSFSVVVTLVAVSVVAGCGSAPAQWQKPGVAQNVAVDEISDCRYKVGVAKVSPAERNQLIQDCMQAKGFRYR